MGVRHTLSIKEEDGERTVDYTPDLGRSSITLTNSHFSYWNESCIDVYLKEIEKEDMWGRKKQTSALRKCSYKENRVVDSKTVTARKHFFPYFKWDGNFHVHLWLSIFPYFNGERKKTWCKLRKPTSLQPLERSGWWRKLRNLAYKWKEFE